MTPGLLEDLGKTDSKSSFSCFGVRQLSPKLRSQGVNEPPNVEVLDTVRTGLFMAFWDLIP